MPGTGGRRKTVPRKSQGRGSSRQPFYEFTVGSGERILRRQARPDPRLLLSGPGKPPERGQDCRRVRLRRLPGGVSVVWCNDLLHYGERCCQGEGSGHKHFGARKCVGRASRSEGLGAVRRKIEVEIVRQAAQTGAGSLI